MKALRGIVGFVALFLAILSWNCGGSDTFRIIGVVEGLGTQNLQVVYYGDGSFHSLRSTAIDGKFTIEGSSRDYTVVDVFTSARSLIATFIVKNGENIECKYELNDVVAKEIKGSKPAVELVKWIAENLPAIESGQNETINRSVEKFIGENSENVVSSVLLTRYFDPRGREREADSLLRSISLKARISTLTESFRDGLVYNADTVTPMLADSLWFVGTESRKIYANPTQQHVTVLYFTTPDGRRVSANDNFLRRLLEEQKKEGDIAIFEINDINEGEENWQQTVERDSLPWERVWHPGVSSTMALPTRPWVVVADSVGQIIYSGSDFIMGINKAKELCL